VDTLAQGKLGWDSCDKESNDKETKERRTPRSRYSLPWTHSFSLFISFNYSSKSGTIMLTNQRIVYLCASPTSFFSSASLPVNNVQDSKLVHSWFSLSPPVFKAVVMPVPGGGLSQPARLSISFTTGSKSGPPYSTSPIPMAMT